MTALRRCAKTPLQQPNLCAADLNRQLGLAFRAGLFNQVRFLLHFGASPNLPINGTPLLALCSTLAEDEWAYSLACLLLEHGAVVEKPDNGGRSALHHAILRQRTELACLLVDASLDLGVRDARGNTALMYAVKYGNVEILRRIVKMLHRYNHSVDQPNEAGVTPLIQAWSERNVVAAKILLSEGKADRDRIEPRTGKTAGEIENEVLITLQKEIVLLPPSRNGRRQQTTPPPAAPLSTSLEQLRNPTPLVLQRSQTYLKKRACPTVIRSKSSLEPQNRPELVFNVSAKDCFHASPKQRGLLDRRAWESCESWKRQMPALSEQLQRQLSTSYRPTAVSRLTTTAAPAPPAKHAKSGKTTRATDDAASRLNVKTKSRRSSNSSTEGGGARTGGVHSKHRRSDSKSSKPSDSNSAKSEARS